MRASVHTITSEVQRLQKMCEERREAEESLQEKWKKIEEFDARRLELEAIYTALLRANMVLAYFNFDSKFKKYALSLQTLMVFMFEQRDRGQSTLYENDDIIQKQAGNDMLQ